MVTRVFLLAFVLAPPVASAANGEPLGSDFEDSSALAGAPFRINASCTVAPNRIERSMSCAHRGVWGVRAVDARAGNGSGCEAEASSFPLGFRSRVFARLWVRVEALDGGSGQFLALNPNSSPPLYTVGFSSDARLLAFEPFAGRGGVFYSRRWTPDWALVELFIENLGRPDGRRTLWVQGSQIDTSTSNFADAGDVDFVGFGFSFNTTESVTGSWCGDDLRLSASVQASSFMLEGPRQVVWNRCVPVSVRFRSSAGTEAPLGAVTTLVFSRPVQVGADCAGPATNAVAFDGGTTSATVSLRVTLNGELRASADDLLTLDGGSRWEYEVVDGGPGFLFPMATSATCNTPYRVSPTGRLVVSGDGPWSFSAPAAPVGFRIDPEAGVVDWKPLRAGQYAITVAAEGPNGRLSQSVQVSVACEEGCGCGQSGDVASMLVFLLLLGVRCEHQRNFERLVASQRRQHQRLRSSLETRGGFRRDGLTADVGFGDRALSGDGNV